MTTTSASTELSVDVITDIAGFAALEHEWRDLYEASPSATPFQTWEWLLTWWEVYGVHGALRLVTARDKDRLVGALPLMATTHGTLRFVGTGLSDHLDALIDRASSAVIVDAWIAHLHQPGVRLLDLHEVRPEAAVWQLYHRWPSRTGHHPQSACAELDAAPLDDLLRRWSKNTRKNARTALKRIDKGGYERHWATPDEIGDMAEELVTAHRQEWEGRGITPAHAEPCFTRFVRTVCERMAHHNEVGLVRLDPPDDAVDPMQVQALMFVGREYVGGWLAANDEAARRRVTAAIVEALYAIELAHRHDIGVISMLRGLESAKLKLHDRVKVNHRLLLAGCGALGTTSWLGWTAPVALTAGLKDWEQRSATGRRVTSALRSARQRLVPGRRGA
jgi:hypothetical protein